MYGDDRDQEGELTPYWNMSLRERDPEETQSVVLKDPDGPAGLFISDEDEPMEEIIDETVNEEEK